MDKLKEERKKLDIIRREYQYSRKNAGTYHEESYCEGYLDGMNIAYELLDNLMEAWPVPTAWEKRVRELEEEGLTRSDAQGVADMIMRRGGSNE
jgi:hypothetical protein